MRLSWFRFRCFHYPLRAFFSKLDHKLKSLCLCGRILEALQIMWHAETRLHPQTYALLLQECIFRKQFHHGKRIHAHMLAVGYAPDQYLLTKLLILYAKFGDLQTAHILFDKMPDRSLVAWNVMISGCVQMGFENEGFNLYTRMRGSGLTPDQFTFASVFRACASLAALEQGKQPHATMIKANIMDNVVVNSALMDMYFKCSSPSEGRRVFDYALERNVITWTSLISGYGQNGRAEHVLELFHQMMSQGFQPNYVTFLAVLSACSHRGLVTEGQRYFCAMTQEYGIKPRLKHYAAMVDLFGRAGRLREAYDFVRNSPCQRHSVVWGALLGACRVHGDIGLVQLAASKYFELEPQNTGKYVVLSNTYAACGLWKSVKMVREAMRESGLNKEPACSWIQIQTTTHIFLVGDNSHQHSEHIYELIKQLACILKDAELPLIKISHG